MSLRRRDVEQWMEHRGLPENLKRFSYFFILIIEGWYMTL